METQIERRDGGEVPVLAVHGELDFDGAPNLRLALVEAIDENPGQRVVVDLEGVDFIDSAGLGVLVGGLKRARSYHGQLVLVATGRSVIRVLELTGLTRVFEIHPSRAAALGLSE
ncbi:MAG TPA: STAS domain-containing protein [Solirubrobacteraceae bacterium]|nr:STAS domain-containing protein [Solirubrobacteraceae bacterium]